MDEFLSAGQNHPIFIAHPSSDAVSLPKAMARLEPDESPVFLAIGPEGGFTDVEMEQATALGWLSVDMGPRILRVETCALALVVALTCADRQ